MPGTLSAFCLENRRVLSFKVIPTLDGPAALEETLNKSSGRADNPSGAKAHAHSEAFSARLKSCPFKAST